MDINTIGGLSTRERALLNSVLRTGKTAISVRDVVDLMSVTRAHANKILSRLERKGWLKRAKRGIYLPVSIESVTPDISAEDPWALAMSLFTPCYISGWSAAEHWDLTEQIFNTTVVYTARAQRKTTQRVAGLSFRIHRIKEEEIFGTKRIWRNNIPIAIADLHRTVIDILDSPELGGGGRHSLDVIRTYWQEKKADPTLLLRYAKRLGRGVIFKRLGFTAETYGRITEEWSEECRQHLSAGISNLDPTGPSKGRIVSRWRLRINLPIESIT